MIDLKKFSSVSLILRNDDDKEVAIEGEISINHNVISTKFNTSNLSPGPYTFEVTLTDVNEEALAKIAGYVNDDALYEKYKYELKAESKYRHVDGTFCYFPVTLRLFNCSTLVSRNMNMNDARNDLMRKVYNRERKL